MTDILKIGILSIQGDIEENSTASKQALDELGIEGKLIYMKNLSNVNEIDGLIIPGGESTVISTLLFLQGIQTELLRNKINDGLPILGTCAGLIMLANRVYDKIIGETKQELLKVLDITAERNAFGRQHESFESPINIPIIGERPFNGVFIRAPIIKKVGNNVQIIAELNGKIVAVRQNNILATSFHPELSNDNRFHMYFIKLSKEYNKSRKQRSKDI